MQCIFHFGIHSILHTIVLLNYSRFFYLNKMKKIKINVHQAKVKNESNEESANEKKTIANTKPNSVVQNAFMFLILSLSPFLSVCVSLTHLLPSLWLIVVPLNTYSFFHYFSKFSLSLVVTILTAVLTDCSADLRAFFILPAAAFHSIIKRISFMCVLSRVLCLVY